MPTPQELNIPDKLDSILATKQAIRESIVAKGVEVPEGTTFRQYEDLINEIQPGIDKYLAKGFFDTLEDFKCLHFRDDMLVNELLGGWVGYLLVPMGQGVLSFSNENFESTHTLSGGVSAYGGECSVTGDFSIIRKNVKPPDPPQ